MAQFYGTAVGKSGSLGSRTGSKRSGLTVSAKSWEGEVRVEMHHDAKTERDHVRIVVGPHGAPTTIIFDGPVEELPKAGANRRIVNKGATHSAYGPAESLRRRA